MMDRAVTILACAVVALLVAGQAGLVALAPSLANAKPMAIADVVPLIVLLSVPAAAGLLVAPRAVRAAPPRVAFVILIAAGLVMRLMWFGAPAPLEDDFQRYLWDGAVTATGGNPYALSPGTVRAGGALSAQIDALRGTGAAVLDAINFPELTTVYPGVAQLVFAISYLVAPWQLDGLRVVYLAGEAAALWALVCLLARTGQSPLMAGLYWLNPLVVFAIFGTGHVDGVLVPLLAGSMLALIAGWPVLAAGALAFAVGVKIWPVVLAPLIFAQIWRGQQRVWAAAGVFVAICALALSPLVAASIAPASGLSAYARDWANNNGPFAWASYGAYLVAGESAVAQSLLRLAVAAGAISVAILAAVQPVSGPKRLLELALIVTAGAFYLQPAQFPWYALGFLPFAAATGCWPLLLPAVTLPAYYAFFPLWNSGQGDLFRYGVAFVHAVPVWGWLLARRLRVQRMQAHSNEVMQS